MVWRENMNVWIGQGRRWCVRIGSDSGNLILSWQLTPGPIHLISYRNQYTSYAIVMIAQTVRSIDKSQFAEAVQPRFLIANLIRPSESMERRRGFC
jgi:hypothetical protein